MDYEFVNIKAVIIACGIVHNFIRGFDVNDLSEDLDDGEASESHGDHSLSSGDGPIAFDFSGTSWRDWVTTEMWREYEEYRRNNLDANSASESSSIDEGEDDEVDTVTSIVSNSDWDVSPSEDDASDCGSTMSD
ncbi:hypothetical protein PHYBOEH_009019 [Phytophthora boehmeriae]|uniref:DDE Tnp4 domain-containing protein n=1 Tax=Phytophthora boehmeriae TaxID=109152 RepID=A0A8T1WZL1_9STRA|nr:hypothetical protein PHYBOEH_009019 [Phytophthora boehmeriae]